MILPLPERCIRGCVLLGCLSMAAPDKARRLKTRYHGGMLAGPMLFLRRNLSDRLFDRVIMMAMR
jgi:hypothetical protein